jgi:hypothetical protein
MDNRKTVRGIYDDGEIRFAEPVDMDGCWNLEITFVEEVDEQGIPLEANPHRPEMIYQRLDQVHQQIDSARGDIVLTCGKAHEGSMCYGKEGQAKRPAFLLLPFSLL